MKGEYDFKDAGQFQFDKILNEEEINGNYFNTVNYILTEDTLIKVLQIASESNMQERSSADVVDVDEFFT